MNANDFFLRAFGRNATINVRTQLEEEFTEVFFKELATACAINMIANTIAKCEIRTFIKGKPEKKEEYYLWNYEPNQNENSSDMIQKFITNLCYDNEALIIEYNGRLYVADTFTRKKYTFCEDVFFFFFIGDITLQKTYRSSEVIYMELNNIDIRQRLEGSYTSYGKVVAQAIRTSLRAGGQKGILNIDAQTSAQPNFTEQLQELIDQRFRPFFESSQAVLPLTSGYTYSQCQRLRILTSA